MKKEFLKFPLRNISYLPKIESRRLRLGNSGDYHGPAYKEDGKDGDGADGKGDNKKDILTKEGLIQHLTDMKAGLETSLKDDANKHIAETLKEKMEAIDAMQVTIKEIKDNAPAPDVLEKLQSDVATTIKAFDLLQTRMKGNRIGGEKKILTLDQAIGEKMLEFGKIDEHGNYKSDLISSALSTPQGSFVLSLKNVSLKAQGADMTLANSLTGDPVATYSQRQAIIPAQKINVRDLIPTVSTASGLYVTYREDTGGTNNIVKQTEGALKGQNEYDFTEVKTVQSYIAGFTVVTKQILKFLPFLQNTITRLLLRDFYKAENAQFFATISGAATGGTSGGTSPDDFIQLINVIGAQLDTDYGVSTAVVSNRLMARLIGATYAKGYYPGAGSIVLNDSRGVTVFGVPVVGASWVTNGYALLMDNDYVERVEAEGLNVTFSFEDSDNFRRNKVTVKVECMEEINILRPESLIYMNLGAS